MMPGIVLSLVLLSPALAIASSVKGSGRWSANSSFFW